LSSFFLSVPAVDEDVTYFKKYLYDSNLVSEKNIRLLERLIFKFVQVYHNEKATIKNIIRDIYEFRNMIHTTFQLANNIRKNMGDISVH